MSKLNTNTSDNHNVAKEPISTSLKELENNIKSLEQIETDLLRLKNEILLKSTALENELEEIKDNSNSNENYSFIQSLYTFESYFVFKSFVKDLYNIRNWKISDKTDDERIALIKDKDYFQKLKKDFNSRNICPYPITNKEVLSYLDTLNILYKVLEEITNQDFKKNVKIIMEYLPKNDLGKDRVDYVIAYKNILILIEFGRSSRRENLKETRMKKEDELDYYKKQIERIVDSSDIKIQTLPIIYQPEKDEQAIEENFNTIKNTANNIKKWINNPTKDAIDFLNEPIF